MQLSDRMTHDPYLADALHEIISAVTSVQSTAAILNDDEALAPEWQDPLSPQHPDGFGAAGRRGGCACPITSTTPRLERPGSPLLRKRSRHGFAREGYHPPLIEGSTLDGAEAYLSGRLSLRRARHDSLPWRGWCKCRPYAQAVPRAALHTALGTHGVAPRPAGCRIWLRSGCCVAQTGASAARSGPRA